jgi:hypothetical protein
LSEDSSGTARVTIEDAARLLGIQYASVRKRIQRGKLRHEQDAEGRIFVYVGLDEIVRDGSVATQGEQGAEQPESRTILERFGGVSAFVAGSAAGVYILGLVALWAPIARTYTHDVTTAWYAVTMVPRYVVAGQGLIPIWFPVVVSFVSLLWPVCINYLSWVQTNLSGPKKLAAFSPIAVMALVAVSFLFWLMWTDTGGLYIAGEWAQNIPFLTEPIGTLLDIAFPQGGFGFEEHGWMTWIYLLFLIVLILAYPMLLIWSNVLLFRATYRSLDTSGRRLLPSMHDRSVFLRSFSIYFVFIFIATFVYLLIFAEPSLPVIEVTANRAITESGSKTPHGAPLTHADGFWYVFNENGGKLLAIPDTSVNRVRMPSG